MHLSRAIMAIPTNVLSKTTVICFQVLTSSMQHRMPFILGLCITLIGTLTGFNADLPATINIKTEGWNVITDWHTVGAEGLYNAHAALNDGKFRPSKDGI